MSSKLTERCFDIRRTFGYGSQGVILLEVLISLMIASAFLSLILPAANQSYQRIRTSQRLGAAVRLAASQVEELSAGIQTGNFPRSRQSGNLTWTIDRVAVESGEVQPGAGTPSLCTYLISISENGDRNPILKFAIKRLHFD